jgi:DnaA-like protein
MKRYRRTPSQEPAYKLLDAALERALVPPRLSHDFQDRLDARLTTARASAETNRSTRRRRLHVPGGVYYVVLRGKNRKSSSDSLNQVIDTVCDTLGLERNEVLSRSRHRRLSLARALITWYATERGIATLAEVGRRLDRDPSMLFVGMERYRMLRPELFNLTTSANPSKPDQSQVGGFVLDSRESQLHSAQDPDHHNVPGKGDGILERITVDSE